LVDGMIKIRQRRTGRVMSVRAIHGGVRVRTGAVRALWAVTIRWVAGVIVSVMVGRCDVKADRHGDVVVAMVVSAVVGSRSVVAVRHALGTRAVEWMTMFTMNAL
jgi:hypothetical protein